MLGLAEFEAHCCPGCGTHETIAAQPDEYVYVPDEKKCAICAGLAMHQRIVGEEDRLEAKALGEHPDPKKPRKKDGRRLLLRPASATEREKRREQIAAQREQVQTKKRRRRGGKHRE